MGEIERKCPFNQPLCHDKCALRDGEMTCLDRVVAAVVAALKPEVVVAEMPKKVRGRGNSKSV